MKCATNNKQWAKNAQIAMTNAAANRTLSMAHLSRMAHSTLSIAPEGSL